jgi:proteasome lid subunit RPN8/RPN11
MSFAPRLEISPELLEQIHRHGENAYPEEGAGFLLGHSDGDLRSVTDLLSIRNAREDLARRNRYLMTPKDVLEGELEAERRGLDIVGVFHSHPDHPNQPSEFDREWALPWYSYLITSVNAGRAAASRSWRLSENRATFYEEEILIVVK